MKRIQCQDQLSLNKLWNNIFFKLSSEIIGDDNKSDYFIISENEDEYKITLATNQVDKWRCMVYPNIALKHKKRTDSYGKYTKEFEKFASDMCEGHIEHGDKGNAKRYVNLRYEELLEYLVQKGNGIIEQEIVFLKETITNSCGLKLYLNDQMKRGNIANEVSVKKKVLIQYKEGIESNKIETLIRDYLKGFYTDIDNVDAIELLSVVVLRTLAEVTIETEEGRRIKNADKIFDLQKQFLQSIENYFNEGNGKAPEVINVSLFVEWKSKFACVRRELIGTHGYPETGELIQALDNLDKIRSAEIGNAIFGVAERCEIRKLREKLNDEMKRLDDFLKSLEIYREYMNGLRERNEIETENENMIFLEQVAPRVLRLDNLV